MKTQIFLLAVIVGVLAAGSAYAANAVGEGDGDARRNRFQRIDTNGDGRIDAQEFAKAHEVRFERMDANGDGVVTQAELEESARKERAERHFKRLDADGDGQVTKAEFAAVGDRMFQHLDADADGYLSMGEVQRRRHGGDKRGDSPN